MQGTNLVPGGPQCASLHFSIAQSSICEHSDKIFEQTGGNEAPFFFTSRPKNGIGEILMDQKVMSTENISYMSL